MFEREPEYCSNNSITDIKNANANNSSGSNISGISGNKSNS